MRCGTYSLRAANLTGVPVLAVVMSLLPVATRAATAIPPAEAAEILRKADVASQAPESFRARLRITPLQGPPGPMEVEVWCSGESKSLVRFLGPKELGKYLLRLDRTVWFIAPGARKPVKVGASHRLRGGASLDDLLGIRYTRDYIIESASQAADDAGDLAVFELTAADKRAPYPRVRYVVRRGTDRPVRAEYLLRSGKTSSVLEFLEWEDGRRPVARRLLLTDVIGAGSRTEVTLLEMLEHPVPEALFDLTDSVERRKLEQP